MKRRALGYLIAHKSNGLQRWAKSERRKVPWTLYSSFTRPTLFPDLHAARVAIREAGKYWSAFGNEFRRARDRTTPAQESGEFYVIRAEAPPQSDGRA